MGLLRDGFQTRRQFPKDLAQFSRLLQQPAPFLVVEIVRGGGYKH
jgi:hypothetical protein